MEKLGMHNGKVKTKRQVDRVARQRRPSHSAEKVRLNRIRGQMDGIDRMIDENRYCVDIITQIRAAKSALQGLEKAILASHLKGCVNSAFISKDDLEIENKISEIMDMIL